MLAWPGLLLAGLAYLFALVWVAAGWVWFTVGRAWLSVAWVWFTVACVWFTLWRVARSGLLSGIVLITFGLAYVSSVLGLRYPSARSGLLLLWSRELQTLVSLAAAAMTRTRRRDAECNEKGLGGPARKDPFGTIAF